MKASPPWFRYLIDVVILIAAVFGLEIAAEGVYTPKSMEAGYTFGLLVTELYAVSGAQQRATSRVCLKFSHLPFQTLTTVIGQL